MMGVLAEAFGASTPAEIYLHDCVGLVLLLIVTVASRAGEAYSVGGTLA